MLARLLTEYLLGGSLALLASAGIVYLMTTKSVKPRDPLPAKMKSVLYKAKGEIGYSPDLMDVPKPKHGQVLIKVEAAVIHPSDTYFMRGFYNGKYTYPLTPGQEGSGTVIASGGGFRGWTLVGKKVGFVRQAEKAGKYSIGGCYAEYCVTSAF